MQICRKKSILEERPKVSDMEIRQWCSVRPVQLEQREGEEGNSA